MTLAWPQLARADRAETLQAVEQAPLAVALHGDALAHATQLAEALHRELKRDVRLQPDLAGQDERDERLTISWNSNQQEVAVSYDRGGRTVTRLVRASGPPARVISDAAALAANLVRIDRDAHPGASPEPAPLEPAPAPPAPEPPAPEPVAAPAAERDAPTAVRPHHLAAVASLAFPAATNLQHPAARTHFEFNLLFGRVGQLDGLQLGTFGLLAGDRSQGADGTLRGLQLSLLASASSGRAHGVQIGGVSAVAAGGLAGVQVGTVTVHGRSGRGAQLGGVNVSAGGLDGVQIGLINVSAGTVRGAQVGLINYAERLQGAQIGPIGITGDGGVHPIAWGSSASFGNVGVQFASRHLFTMPFLSLHHAGGRLMGGGGGAIGGRVHLHRLVELQADVAFGVLYSFVERRSIHPQNEDYREILLQPRLRSALHVRPLKHLSLFAGAGLLVEVRPPLDAADAEVRVGPEFFAGIRL